MRESNLSNYKNVVRGVADLREVVATVDAVLGDSMRADLHVLALAHHVADVHHTDLLHVAKLIPMFRRDQVVLIDVVIAVVVQSHVQIRNQGRDPLHARADGPARRKADPVLRHESNEGWNLHDARTPKALLGMAVAKYPQRENIPDHHPSTHAHHLLDHVAIEHAVTHPVEALPHEERETVDANVQTHHPVMDRETENEEDKTDVVEATDVHLHHPMNTEAIDVLT